MELHHVAQHGSRSDAQEYLRELIYFRSDSRGMLVQQVEELQYDKFSICAAIENS